MGEGHRLLGDYRGDSDMRVGDLVKAKHWDCHLIGVIISIRPKTGICKVALIKNLDWRFDQLKRDLEVICK